MHHKWLHRWSCIFLRVIYLAQKNSSDRVIILVSKQRTGFRVAGYNRLKLGESSLYCVSLYTVYIQKTPEKPHSLYENNRELLKLSNKYQTNELTRLFSLWWMIADNGKLSSFQKLQTVCLPAYQAVANVNKGPTLHFFFFWVNC